MDASADIAARIARLDNESRDLPPGFDGLDRFILVMQHVASVGLRQDNARLPHADAEEVDTQLQKCRLLNELQAIVPSIVSGPLDRASQYWIGVGEPVSEPALAADRFVDIAAGEAGGNRTKPFGVGLFTSTGAPNDFGMWHRYLQFQGNSGPYPLPWRAWKLTLDSAARVAEVTTAREWVDLIRSYPHHAKGFLFPDWSAIGADFDAVHISLRAIAATQCVFFHTDAGHTAPPFWDVESTFWLHWRISSSVSTDL